MIKKIVKLIIFAFILLIGYSSISIYTYSHVNELKKADAAIVLGAAAWGREPSPVFRERINHAIWLYEQGYVDKIIFTGGKRIEADLAEAEVGKIYALEQNIPEHDILIEVNSMNTEENLKNAYALALQYDLHTFIIVSDPLHMKRAKVISEHLGIEAYSSPTDTSAFETFKTKFPFFVKEVVYYTGYLLRFALEKIMEYVPLFNMSDFF